MTRSFRSDPRLLRALISLAVFAASGVGLVWLYPDADQQDSGYHYLFARWAHHHPHYFVSVWARPLFTLLYFFPAQFGYAATKLFTVTISLATAWQTFRLAQQIKFHRAELAILLLFLQPSFFLLCSTVLTETLFALLFVIALRLHLSGRIRAGMIVASLLILVRPEGFFIGALWGLWVLFVVPPSGGTLVVPPSGGTFVVPPSGGTFVVPPSGRIGLSVKTFRLKAVLQTPLKAGLQTLLLASGMILWWAAAYLITGDPLWIVHDWPPDWRPAGVANGAGQIWKYIVLSPLIVGPLLLAPFIVGLRRLLKKREFITGVSAFLVLFVAHSLMSWRGWFGSAGYARYLVCVAPAIALITLAGWNDLAERQAKFFNTARSSIAATVFALSVLVCIFYVDGWRFTRDARAVEEMVEWFRAHPRPVSRLICSQAYMRIVFDRDQWEKPTFTNDREHNLTLIRQSPRQTLIFWDEDTGPKWYGLRAGDFEAADYVRLTSQEFRLEGWFLRLPWDRFGGPRIQQMSFYYKE